MQPNETISALKKLEPSLRAQGICGLYVFGSLSRGDNSDSSDVDVMFDLSPDAKFSLFDQARISRQLSEKLHAKVDFVPRRSLHPLVKASAEAERVKVFGA
jgi:uncharacterized protein